MESGVQSHANVYGIYGGQSHWDGVFSEHFCILCQYHYTNAAKSYLIHLLSTYVILLSDSVGKAKSFPFLMFTGPCIVEE